MGMNSPITNPAHWRIGTLLSLGPDELHQLARTAAGTLTSYRLILGRCLLAMQHNGAFKKRGCSSAVHYGTAVLGLHLREARTCKRVAHRLRGLPSLTLAAESGSIPWSKLREIVRKASPETETYWIKLAGGHSYREIELLVRRTPRGALPGDVETACDSCTSELRCSLSDEAFAMLSQARRAYSLEKGEAVTTAEVLEWALVSYLASHPNEVGALEKVRESTDRDIQAERARELPIVDKAREIAADMGLLGEAPSAVNEEEPLVQAIGGEPSVELGATDETGTVNFTKELAQDENDPQRVTSADSLVTQTWENPRLRYNPKSRHTTTAQKKEILRRDGWCCNTPGCPNKVWLHVHHLKAYSQGGTTEPQNLLCLCAGCLRRSHYEVRNHHRGLLQVIVDDAGHLTFADEDGRSLKRQANLELAGWLDFWLGWKGKRSDSYTKRAHSKAWEACA